MRKETKEIVKLTCLEVLKKLGDVAARYYGAFDRSRFARRDLYQYFEDREIDKSDFSKKIHYLKQKGLIRKVCEGKSDYIELTEKGVERLDKLETWDIKVVRPKKWDKRWRIVIYDIKEKDRTTRNAIRKILYKIGFLQIQKSVFVYPFECNAEIDQICKVYGERDAIKYMIADIIEGEESIIEKFLDTGVLNRNDLL